MEQVEHIQQRSSARATPPPARWPMLLGVLDSLAVLIAVVASAGESVPMLVAYAVLVPLMFAASGSYMRRLHFDAIGRTPQAVGAVTVAAMTLITVDFMGVSTLGVTPRGIGLLWLVTVGGLSVGRLLAEPIYRQLFRDSSARKALIVGSGFAAVLAAEKIDTHPEYGLQTVGFVDDGPRKSVRGRPEPLLGTVKEIRRLIDETGAEVVVFGYTQHAADELLVALYQMEPRVEVLVMPRFFQYVSAGMKVEDLAGLPLLRLHRHELSMTERAVKRAADVVLASIVLTVILPLMPIVALAIKLDSRGPVLFKHERIGRMGKPFSMYKFRSMEESAELDDVALARLAEEDPRGLKNKADARITRVGGFLRTSSIDELPQLFNVLKGDMSLVGPRPAVAVEVAAYDEWQKKRLAVAPGITGLWQVSGRSDVPFDERIWLDFMYIDSWSLWLDLGILLKTVPAILSAKGAY